MDQLQFLKEVFPHKTEDQIQYIVEIVEQVSPLDSPDEKIGQIFNMLAGDGENNGPLQENVQEQVLLGQVEEDREEDPNDEDHEEAVGFGHPTPINRALLNQNFQTLQNIFPEAAPDFLWNYCQKKGNSFDLDIALTEISRDGYDRIVQDSNAVWERLMEALPDWDPSYLKEQALKLALEDPKNLEEFVSAALDKDDYPTKETYLKRKKEEDKINSFKDENFKLDKFLETFPDPETHFSSANRRNPLVGDNIPEEDFLYAKTFLYNRYPDVRKRHIDLVFRTKKMCLLDSCDMLDRIKKGLKIKRKDETMPESNNLELLQEVSYLKHRRLILRLMKYKDETYRRFKEEARALNLLETCLVCDLDDLIPEECFNCQKGCTFCKDCVRKYVEVRMGDGLTTFPCCNDCDSEFSLHIIQMALPRHTFERLVLKIQSEEIKKANVDGLETCPFCDFASIPLENTTVFKCENSECLKESCRICRHVSHIPKRCDEIEYDEDVRRRTFIENMMTEALARTCSNCQKKFVKSNGCNKMICTCGAIMCYLCSQRIQGYDHFGSGKPCQLFTNDAQIDLTRIRERAERAKQELGNVKIKFDPSEGIENFYPV